MVQSSGMPSNQKNFISDQEKPQKHHFRLVSHNWEHLPSWRTGFENYMDQLAKQVLNKYCRNLPSNTLHKALLKRLVDQQRNILHRDELWTDTTPIQSTERAWTQKEGIEQKDVLEWDSRIASTDLISTKMHQSRPILLSFDGARRRNGVGAAAWMLWLRDEYGSCGRVLRNASAMTAEREALRMGIQHLTVLFPTEVTSFDFQVENSWRTVQYKLNAQSLRLFGLHSDVNGAHRAGANRLQNNKQTKHMFSEASLAEWREGRLPHTFYGTDIEGGSASTTTLEGTRSASSAAVENHSCWRRLCAKFHRLESGRMELVAKIKKFVVFSVLGSGRNVLLSEIPL